MKSKIGLVFTFFLALTIALCFLFASFCYNLPQQYRGQILKNATMCGIEPSLVASVIKTESNFKQNAVSSAGAIGLMQLMPSTAQWLAEKVNIETDSANFFEPELNIMLGCTYLNMLFLKFNTIENVLCAYNAGPSNAEKWLKNSDYTQNGVIVAPPFKETSNYVKKVLFYKKFYNLVW